MVTNVEPWNGPGRELNGGHEDDEVYCVQCGTTFVYADGRDCPSCTLKEELDQLKDTLDGRLDEVSDMLGDVSAQLGDAVMERAADVLDGEDLEVFHAIRRSDAHADLSRYYVKAVNRDHTGVVSSLRTFYRGNGVQRLAELGTPKEKVLYERGAVAALDGHTWDTENEAILKEIAEESHGVNA